MSEFKREERYIVIKLKRLTARQCAMVQRVFPSIELACVTAAVVEKDWPEYPMVWAMIEHRMAGKPVPDFNLWRQADALTAQRDQGMAREAELLEQRDSLANEMFDLQQRLAEATDLLKHMTCSYHRALENGYDRIIFLGGDCDSVDKMEKDDPFYAKARAFLAKPSRADQEQPS